jgi:hypothetical protein
VNLWLLFQRYCDALAVALDSEFGADVHVVGKRDPMSSGRFEVTIKETGELIHSKATRGQGRCESKAEKDAVIAKVQAALEKQ